MLFFPFNKGTFTSADNGTAATKVFGQPDFTSSKTSTSDTGMSGPHHLSSDTDGRPYVVDSGNNRVLIFDPTILNTPNAGAHASFVAARERRRRHLRQLQYRRNLGHRHRRNRPQVPALRPVDFQPGRTRHHPLQQPDRRHAGSVRRSHRGGGLQPGDVLLPVAVRPQRGQLPDRTSRWRPTPSPPSSRAASNSARIRPTRSTGPIPCRCPRITGGYSGDGQRHARRRCTTSGPRRSTS